MWYKRSFDMMVVPHKIHISLFLRFSQPAHCVLLLLSVYLGFHVFSEHPSLPWQPSTLSALLYISTFATHFGTQIWMTFISGIVLFFNLPRKLFGMVQRQLFPKYFLLNSILGFVTLSTFMVHNPSLDQDLNLQKWVLAVCLLCDMLAMMYIVPDMVTTMETRGAMEEKTQMDLPQLKQSPEYVQLHRRFRRFHGACAIVNFLAMFCNVVHMYHLSWKLRSALT